MLYNIVVYSLLVMCKRELEILLGVSALAKEKGFGKKIALLLLASSSSWIPVVVRDT